MRTRHLSTHTVSKVPLKYVINSVTLFLICIHENNVYATSLHMYAFIYKIYIYTTLFINQDHFNVNYNLI